MKLLKINTLCPDGHSVFIFNNSLPIGFYCINSCITLTTVTFVLNRTKWASGVFLQPEKLKKLYLYLRPSRSTILQLLLA